MRKYNPTKSKVFIDETGKVSFMYQQEGAREVAKEYPRDREWQKLVKKHKRAIEAFQKGRDLDSKAEKELVSWAMKNGEIKTDDVDETDEWLQNIILANESVKEEGPCWPGYKQVGTKMKNGKEVPNCVPIDEEVNEKLKGYQSSYQRKSKYDGKEFNAKQEFKTLDKIQKALEVADKHHQNLQYPYVVDTVTRLWDHLAKASVGIIEYKRHIDQGKYDGKIDKDD